MQYTFSMPILREPVLPSNISSSELQEMEHLVFADCEPSKSDLLFFFGYSEPDEEWMLRVALQEWAPWIMLTGRHAANLPEGSRTESHHVHQVLVEGGIDRKRILLEDRSTNTTENVICAKQVLDDAAISPRSILAACRSYHSGRCLRTLAKYFPEVALSCITCDPVFEGITVRKSDWRQNRVSQARVYGEYLRIKEYSERGFIC